MNVLGTLVDGSPVEVTAFDGQVVGMLSPRPFAPGAPFTVRLDLPGEPLELHGKAHGSKRTSDGRFEVRGRPVGLRKEDRERILAVIAS